MKKLRKLYSFKRLPFYYNSQARLVLEAIMHFAETWLPKTNSRTSLHSWCGLEIGFDDDSMAVIGYHNRPDEPHSYDFIKADTLELGIRFFAHELLSFAKFYFKVEEESFNCSNQMVLIPSTDEHAAVLVKDFAYLVEAMSGNASTFSKEDVEAYVGKPFNPLATESIKLIYAELETLKSSYKASTDKINADSQEEIAKIRAKAFDDIDKLAEAHNNACQSMYDKINYIIKTAGLLQEEQENEEA